MATRKKKPDEQPEAAAPTVRTLSIEYVPLDEIATWPKNPKEHALPALYRSMGRFGFTNPMIVNEANGQLLAGHGRLQALIDSRSFGEDPPVGIQLDPDGRWLAPVVRGVQLDDEDHAKYTYADNRTQELGGWDDQLAALLDEVEAEWGLEGTEFTDADFDEVQSAAPRKKKAGSGVEDADPTPAMGLQAFEHYDYVVIVFKDRRDWIAAQDWLDLDAPLDDVGKRGRIGRGRALDGATFLRRVTGTEAAPSETVTETDAEIDELLAETPGEVPV